MTGAPLVVRVADTERDARREYVFASSPIRVGRSQQNELALEHPFVSHAHGLFVFDSDHVAFVDFGSTNGTFLNGARLEKNRHITLHDGAAITIGPLRLETRLEHPRALLPPTDTSARGDLLQQRLQQRFAQSFVELRRGQHHLLRKLGLPIPSDDKLHGIDSAHELLVYLLDPTASEDRMHELSCAYADLMRHEVALVSAIGAGCRELLDELSPTQLSPEGLGGLAGWFARLFGYDARWRGLENKAEELREQTALSAVVFGRSFARAYVEARASSTRERSPTTRGPGDDHGQRAERREFASRVERGKP